MLVSQMDPLPPICVTSLMSDPLQVHVFLYLYYGLTAIGYQPTWKRRLTEMQIIQVSIIVFFCFFFDLMYNHYFFTCPPLELLPVLGQWER